MHRSMSTSTIFIPRADIQQETLRTTNYASAQNWDRPVVTELRTRRDSPRQANPAARRILDRRKSRSETITLKRLELTPYVLEAGKVKAQSEEILAHPKNTRQQASDEKQTAEILNLVVDELSKTSKTKYVTKSEPEIPSKSDKVPTIARSKEWSRSCTAIEQNKTAKARRLEKLVKRSTQQVERNEAKALEKPSVHSNAINTPAYQSFPNMMRTDTAFQSTFPVPAFTPTPRLPNKRTSIQDPPTTLSSLKHVSSEFDSVTSRPTRRPHTARHQTTSRNFEHRAPRTLTTLLPCAPPTTVHENKAIIALLQPFVRRPTRPTDPPALPRGTFRRCAAIPVVCVNAQEELVARRGGGARVLRDGFVWPAALVGMGPAGEAFGWGSATKDGFQAIVLPRRARSAVSRSLRDAAEERGGEGGAPDSVDGEDADLKIMPQFGKHTKVGMEQHRYATIDDVICIPSPNPGFTKEELAQGEMETAIKQLNQIDTDSGDVTFDDITDPAMPANPETVVDVATFKLSFEVNQDCDNLAIPEEMCGEMKEVTTDCEMVKPSSKAFKPNNDEPQTIPNFSVSDNGLTIVSKGISSQKDLELLQTIPFIPSAHTTNQENEIDIPYDCFGYETASQYLAPAISTVKAGFPQLTKTHREPVNLLYTQSSLMNHLKRTNSAHTKPRIHMRTHEQGYDLPNRDEMDPNLMRCGTSRPRSAYLLGLEEKWIRQRNLDSGSRVSSVVKPPTIIQMDAELKRESIVIRQMDVRAQEKVQEGPSVPGAQEDEMDLQAIMTLYKDGQIPLENPSLSHSAPITRLRTQSSRYDNRTPLSFRSITIIRGDHELIGPTYSNPRTIVAQSEGWTSELGEECDCDNNDLTVREQDLDQILRLAHMEGLVNPAPDEADGSQVPWVTITPGQRYRSKSDTVPAQKTERVKVGRGMASNDVGKHLDSMVLVKSVQFASNKPKEQPFPVVVTTKPNKRKAPPSEPFEARTEPLAQMEVVEAPKVEVEDEPEPELSDSDDSDTNSIDIKFKRNEHPNIEDSVPDWVDMALCAYLYLEGHAIIIQRRWCQFVAESQQTRFLDSVIYCQRMYRARRTRRHYKKLLAKRNLVAMQKQFDALDRASEITLTGECRRPRRNAFACLVLELQAYLAMQKRAQDRADLFLSVGSQVVTDSSPGSEAISMAEPYDAVEKEVLDPVRSRLRAIARLMGRSHFRNLRSSRFTNTDVWMKMEAVVKRACVEYAGWWESLKGNTMVELKKRLSDYMHLMVEGSVQSRIALPLPSLRHALEDPDYHQKEAYEEQPELSLLETLLSGQDGTVVTPDINQDENAALKSLQISPPSLEHLYKDNAPSAAETNSIRASKVTRSSNYVQTAILEIGQDEEPLQQRIIRNPLCHSKEPSEDSPFDCRNLPRMSAVKFSDTPSSTYACMTQLDRTCPGTGASIRSIQTRDMIPHGHRLEGVVIINRSSIMSRPSPMPLMDKFKTSAAHFMVQDDTIAAGRSTVLRGSPRRTVTSSPKSRASRTEGATLAQTQIDASKAPELRAEKRQERREARRRAKLTSQLLLRDDRVRRCLNEMVYKRINAELILQLLTPGQAEVDAVVVRKSTK
ncbi:hypothetical protein BC830DRAFT_1092850 [Chytriomyces sp. MP71]|nr:hypothetical protein BC830DRAFT_1092850 [Chytriomyces sp. MP71]